MKIPGVKTAKAFSRWVQARILGGALILGYHRIAEAVEDSYEVCVTAEHFSEHMQVVKQYARPLSLFKLVQHLKAGSLSPKSIAVTFDDGYADNLYQAKPVLEKYEIPATVFVCTGYAGREFWWDELDRLIMSSKTQPGALRLEVGNKLFVWHRPDVGPEADLDVRRKFRHVAYNFLLTLDAQEQNQAMNTIRSWSGVSSDETTTSRALSHSEIRQLIEGELIELGSHTRHHLMLPAISLEQQRAEIIVGKQDLEDLLGKRVDGFAYPNGRACGDTRRIVREAGFTFACTSLHDVVRPGDNLHELTRFWQRNVDGDEFLKSLHMWMKSDRT